MVITNQQYKNKLNKSYSSQSYVKKLQIPQNQIVNVMLLRDMLQELKSMRQDLKHK